MFRLIIFLCILFILDLYIFQGVRFVSRNVSPHSAKIIYIVYWSVTVFCIGVILIGNIIDWHTWPKALRTYSFAFVFVTCFSKVFVLAFFLIDDVTRGLRFAGTWIYQRFQDAPHEGIKISRSAFLTKLGFIVGAIPFTALLIGMMRGKYQYRIHRVNLALENLPKAFDGLKVVQISDLHCGSFMRPEPIREAIEMIMNEKPDLIFFTGDLVNDRHEEALPFADALSKLKAPHGVFSIFGNHDYGDYMQWSTPEAKVSNLENLKQVHGQLGWRLLLDENHFIEKDGERLGIIGVQNWSTRMRFQRYGNLKKAVKNFIPAPVNILLSHDPSHWRGEIIENHSYINLTLSGHTHGFQFGIDIPGFKWSPVQYVYKEWAGLYKHGNQFLYVNRGLGFLGYPGRVGILPEITVFQLASA